MTANATTNGYRPRALIADEFIPSASRHSEDIATAAILFDKDFAARNISRVDPRHFSIETNRRAVALAKDAIERFGSCCPVLVGERLVEEMGWCDEQMVEFFRRLGEVHGIAPYHAPEALATIAERARRDQLETRLSRLFDPDDHGARLFDQFDSAETCAALESALEEARGGSSTEDATLADTLSSDPAEEPEELVRTGEPVFDNAQPLGAVERGSMLVFGAPPGGYKSALALQATLGALRENPEGHAVWALGEMTARQLRNRALSNLSRLTFNVLRRPWEELSAPQAEAKRAAIEELRSLGSRWHIVSAPLTPARIETAIQRAGAVWCVLDYLQLARPETTGASRRDDVDAVLRRLVEIKQRDGAALLVLSNMPKGDGRPRDVYSAFKESSEIGHATDGAFIGERLEADDDDPLADDVTIRWRCLKQRSGPLRDFSTRFTPSIQRFARGQT